MIYLPIYQWVFHNELSMSFSHAIVDILVVWVSKWFLHSDKCAAIVESTFVVGCTCPANNCGLRDPLKQLWAGYNNVLFNAAMNHVLVKKVFFAKFFIVYYHRVMTWNGFETTFCGVVVLFVGWFPTSQVSSVLEINFYYS